MLTLPSGHINLSNESTQKYAKYNQIYGKKYLQLKAERSTWSQEVVKFYVHP